MLDLLSQSIEKCSFGMVFVIDGSAAYGFRPNGLHEFNCSLTGILIKMIYVYIGFGMISSVAYVARG